MRSHSGSPHARASRFAVGDNQVRCPVKGGSVDIEICYMCAAFEDLVQDGDSAWVYCRGSTPTRDLVTFV